MDATSLRVCLAGLMFAIAGLRHPTPTHAAGSSLIATNLYPRHTTITSLIPLSNVQMDCDWGFACQAGQPVPAEPVFHFRTQDDLHRLSGWAQFGDHRGQGTRMLFAVVASRYSADDAGGLPWNVQAFADFRGTLMAMGYTDLERVPRTIPRGAVGNAGLQIARSPGGDVMAMVCWTASIEVEGIVVYAHGSRADHTLALHDLTRQVRAAVAAIEPAARLLVRARARVGIVVTDSN